MKPEFSKPFNLEHARAGAPIGCINGLSVKIHNWAARCAQTLILGEIAANNADVLAAWSEGGRTQRMSDCFDLVMLPLGLIDGKPVFVGDAVLAAPRGDTPELTNAFVGMTFPAGHAWAWPAPAKVYPETLMKPSELYAVPGVNEFWAFKTLERIATAALRHAIDAGQVVPVSEAKAGVRPHNPYTGALRDPLDIESDPMGVLIRHPDEPMLAAKDRTARDMAVAIAVRDELVASVARYSTGCSEYINSGFDFAAIIATVK